MPAPGSVTNWLVQLKEGDAAAAQPLWERYFPRMVVLARKWLQGARRREADEEDVALSAFDSFCRGAAQGRFPQLADRDDLWRLLVVVTARKALDLLGRHRPGRRGQRLGGDAFGVPFQVRPRPATLGTEDRRQGRAAGGAIAVPAGA
jgi:hypothetical protein